MKKKTIFIVSFLLLITIAFHSKTAKAQVTVSAQAASLMNADTGEFLFTKAPNLELPIASLTKIMTAIIAIENGDLNALVTISEEAANQPPSKLYLQPGDSLTLEDLLYGLLLESGNDAAYAIAEYIGGNVENFVQLMNQKAQSLGLYNTTFTNPSGLSEPAPNISTVIDLARLMRYTMQNPSFAKIAGTKSYQTTTTLGVPLEFQHKHRLVQQVDYVIAGKTGYTQASGRTLISYAVSNGIPLITVTLNDPDDWVDHLNMFQYGYSLYGIDVPTPEIRGEEELENQEE
jgi:D-alanyl-D-alanine carboxypeptidase